MGAKRKRNNSMNNYNNVVEINQFQKQEKQVNILPRNKNQETYVLKLLDAQKDIVFGIGPAGTGKTLLAVQVAVKQFKEGQMKMLLTRLGENSMMAVTGDLAQADRMQDNGLINFVNLMKSAGNATHLDIVRFEQGDIERHNAVKEVLQVYGDE